MIPKFDLDHIFTYHRPEAEDVLKYEEIRDAAKAFAKIVDRLVPDGADKSDAIRKVREAVMTANAGMALGGRLHVPQGGL